MAFAGLIFIGLLFGVILGGSVVGFIVVRAGGPLKESLFGDGAGKHPFSSPPKGPELTPEADTRRSALLEELRITQKLLDQGRVEREQHEKAAQVAAAEMAAMRDQIADRDQRIQDLEASLREATLRSERSAGPAQRPDGRTGEGQSAAQGCPHGTRRDGVWLDGNDLPDQPAPAGA